MKFSSIFCSHLSIFAFFVQQTIAEVDYCKLEREKCRGEPHIACSGFCSDIECKKSLGQCTSLKTVPFSDELKKLVVERHNELRNEIAGGKLKYYPPASKMMKMVSFFLSFSSFWLIWPQFNFFLVLGRWAGRVSSPSREKLLYAPW